MGTLIIWAPTLLFILIVLLGFLLGLIRGLRKSVILLIHMIVIGSVCFGLYLWVVNLPQADKYFVDIADKLIGNFTSSSSLADMMGVEGETLKEIILNYSIANMSQEDLIYYLFLDQSNYINTMVDMSYRIIFAILFLIIFYLLTFIGYLIYLIFYPVRRKVKKENIKFQNGLVKHPYRKKRLLGGCVGGLRSIMIGIIAFSFLGSILFVVTGGTNVPNRNKENIDFNDENVNEIYDYYSYICEMSDTGIFKLLNSIKDPNETPYYFYFADVVLQGNIVDEQLQVDDKFYFRDETGYYVNFIKQSFLLLVNNMDSNSLADFFYADMETKIQYLMDTMKTEFFINGFSTLIDEFETKPYFINVIISSTVSLVNNLNKVVEEDNIIYKLVSKVFKSEEGIKVNELLNETDAKNIFKAVIKIVPYAMDVSKIISQSSTKLSYKMADETSDTKLVDVLSKCVEVLLPTIQNLSVFNEREDKGEKLLAGIYEVCSNEFVPAEVTLPELSSDISWVNEFNILFDSIEPLCDIAFAILPENINDKDLIISNLFNIFSGPDADIMESKYDEFTINLTKSSLLDFLCASIFSPILDDMIVDITKDENASLPKNVIYSGENGEFSVLLKGLKNLIKHGGEDFYLALSKDSFTSDDVKLVFNCLDTKIDSNQTLVQSLLESDLLHYFISTVLMETNFGDFKIYAAEEIIYEVKEVNNEQEKIYKIIQKEEILNVVDTIVKNPDLVVELMFGEKNNIDYAKIFSNNSLVKGIKNSILLKGSIANFIISMTEDEDMIVLPEGYGHPENWLTNASGHSEIDILVDALNILAFEKDSSGNSTINLLLNADIKLNSIMDLSNEFVSTAYTSNVLKYTISNLITNDIENGDEKISFTIPYASLEIKGAPTTKDNLFVDVIKKDDFIDFISQLKKIVEFDQENKMVIKYNQIFNNKEELFSSIILQSVLIGFCCNGEFEAISVPLNYYEDYEKIKTESDLTNNLWFGNLADVKDDELYKLFSAVEVLIIDEEGNIPEDFDFNPNFEELISIKKDSINTITSSIVLNNTITKYVTNSMITPKSALDENGIILTPELETMFNLIFEIMDETVIKISDIKNMDIRTMYLSKQNLLDISKSQILMTHVSNEINSLEQILIPIETVDIVEVCENDKQIENVKLLKTEEYLHLVDALFILFAVDDKVLIDSIDMNNIIITANAVEPILLSQIISTTISNSLIKVNTLTILAETIEDLNVYVNDEIEYSEVKIIENVEIKNLLMASIEVLGKDGQLEIDFKNQTNIDAQNIKLNTELVNNHDSIIYKSKILMATISTNIINVDNLIINVELIESKDVYYYENNELKNEFIIVDAEIENLLIGMFSMIEAEEIVVSELTSQFDSLNVNSNNLENILKSTILSNTMSVNVINANVLEIPDNVLIKTQIINGEIVDVIDGFEMENFFAAILLTNSNSINVNNFTIDNIVLPTTKEDADVMVKSLIVAATLSIKVDVEDSILIIIDSVKVNYVYSGILSENKYIEIETLSNLIISLTVGLGMTNLSNLKVDNILIPSNEIATNALVESVIMRATISSIVLKQNNVYIIKNSTNISTDYYDNTEILIISAIELKALITGLNVFGGNDFNNLTLDIAKIFETASDKSHMLDVIAASEIYRGIMSSKLQEEVGTSYYYQLICSETPEYNGYIYDEYTAGKYIIKAPQEYECYSGFNCEQVKVKLFTKEDILALDNCNLQI